MCSLTELQSTFDTTLLRPKPDNVRAGRDARTTIHEHTVTRHHTTHTHTQHAPHATHTRHNDARSVVGAARPAARSVHCHRRRSALLGDYVASRAPPPSPSRSTTAVTITMQFTAVILALAFGAASAFAPLRAPVPAMKVRPNLRQHDLGHPLTTRLGSAPPQHRKHTRCQPHREHSRAAGAPMWSPRVAASLRRLSHVIRPRDHGSRQPDLGPRRRREPSPPRTTTR